MEVEKQARDLPQRGTVKHPLPPSTEGRRGDRKTQTVRNSYTSFSSPQPSPYKKQVQGHLHYVPVSSNQVSSPTQAEMSKALEGVLECQAALRGVKNIYSSL